MPEIFSIRLETERLILRPFTMDDVDPAYEMNLDPEVSRYTHDGGVRPRDDIESRIKNDVLGDYTKHGFGRFVVIHKADDRFIGFSSLKFVDEFDEVDLGYRFVQAYWGQGIATEAGWASLDFGFNQLKLSRIIAVALEENQGSINVMDKLGFTFDKTIKEGPYSAAYYKLDVADYLK